MVMQEDERARVNIFRPRGTSMKRETRVIAMVLAGWLFGIVGSQAVVFIIEHTSPGAPLSQWTFFNLRLPFWLTGQFLPLWFIIQCVVFNIWMDRHAARDLDSTLRFRVPSSTDREV